MPLIYAAGSVGQRDLLEPADPTLPSRVLEQAAGIIFWAQPVLVARPSDFAPLFCRGVLPHDGLLIASMATNEVPHYVPLAWHLENSVLRVVRLEDYKFDQGGTRRAANNILRSYQILDDMCQPVHDDASIRDAFQLVDVTHLMNYQFEAPRTGGKAIANALLLR